MEKKLISCFTVLIMVSTLNATPKPMSPIVNGEIASLSDVFVETRRFAFAVSFGYRVDGAYFHFCGGSLIASDSTLGSWAISAAHCFSMSRKENETIYAKIGGGDLSNDDNNDTKDCVVEKIIKANFCPYSFQNDVAIVRIYCEHHHNEIIQFATTMSSKECLIYGYGSTSYETNILPSNSLQFGRVRTISYKKCEEIMGRAVAPMEGSGEFCAQGIAPDFADACGGDSGSALICSDDEGQYKLLGIVSYGMGCGSIDSAGVYQSIIYHRQWIDLTLEKEFKRQKRRNNRV